MSVPAMSRGLVPVDLLPELIVLAKDAQVGHETVSKPQHFPSDAARSRLPRAPGFAPRCLGVSRRAAPFPGLVAWHRRRPTRPARACTWRPLEPARRRA